MTMPAEHAQSTRVGRIRCLPRRRVLGAAALAAVALLTGCGTEFSNQAAARAVYAREAQGPVLIAAIEDSLGPGFVQGIELAVEQINADDGGVLGRPLRVRRFAASDDDLRGSLRAARRIAHDPRVSAVLGHRSSEVAVPASVIYERAQVLFLPSFATAEQLTRHGFGFVLRTLPDNAAMAAQTASVVELMGHRRVAVLHGRDDYARGLAFLFEDEARARGLGIAFSASFFERETNFRGILGQLNGVSFDALYLSAEHDAGARLLRQFRELGFEQPVFGSDRLAYGDFTQLVGSAGDRTVVPAVYDLDTPGPRNQAFIEAFRAAYGTEPDQAAAQGYDVAQLFAVIARTAGSTEPTVLATTSRYMPPRAGVTGIFAYDPRGNVYGKVYGFNVLRFGRWWSLPGVTAPHRLASFRAAREAITREEQQQAGLPATPDAPPAGAPTMPADGAAAPAEPAPMVAAGVSPAGNAGAAAGASAQAPAATDTIDLDALTTARLSAAERNRIWLALAHEVLGFERLGLVVPQTGAGSGAVGLVRSLADSRGFSVEICALPAPDAAPGEPPSGPAQAERERPGQRAEGALEQAAVRCWSRLARTVDAMLVVPDAGLRPDLVRRLNRTLRDFRVPSFALAQALDADLGLTLALVASGVNLDDPRVALRFGGVLRGMQVSALNRKLANLPAVSADLKAFARLGIRPDPRLLTLVSRAIEPDFVASRSAAAAPPPRCPTHRPRPSNDAASTASTASTDLNRQMKTARRIPTVGASPPCPS
jgi:ABC-type branched-subunit amino acid transport system substrate-binding protein